VAGGEVICMVSAIIYLGCKLLKVDLDVDIAEIRKI
jgi:hypothetical protein